MNEAVYVVGGLVVVAVLARAGAELRRNGRGKRLKVFIPAAMAVGKHDLPALSDETLDSYTAALCWVAKFGHMDLWDDPRLREQLKMLGGECSRRAELQRAAAERAAFDKLEKSRNEAWARLGVDGKQRS